jgi:hypothetical protein
MLFVPISSPKGRAGINKLFCVQQNQASYYDQFTTQKDI